MGIMTDKTRMDRILGCRRMYLDTSLPALLNNLYRRSHSSQSIWVVHTPRIEEEILHIDNDERSGLWSDSKQCFFGPLGCCNS